MKRYWSKYNLLDVICIILLLTLFSAIIHDNNPKTLNDFMSTLILIVLYPLIYFVIMLIPKMKKYITLSNIILFIWFIFIYVIFGWNWYPLEILYYYYIIILFLLFKFIFQNNATMYRFTKILFLIFSLMPLLLIYKSLIKDTALTDIVTSESVIIFINAIYCYFLLFHLMIKDHDYQDKKLVK